MYVCIIGMNSEENDEENNEGIVNTYPTYIIRIYVVLVLLHC